MILYEDKNGVSFQVEDGRCYLKDNDAEYMVAGHPYTPRIYVSDKEGVPLAVIQGDIWFPTGRQSEQSEWQGFCYKLLELIRRTLTAVQPVTA